MPAGYALLVILSPSINSQDKLCRSITAVKCNGRHNPIVLTCDWNKHT